MADTIRPSGKVLRWLLAALALAGISGAWIVGAAPRGERQAAAPAAPTPPAALKLVAGGDGQLELSNQLIRSLDVHAVQVRSAHTHERLSLSGSLFLDPNRMVRVHARFPGEVVSIGQYQPPAKARPCPARPLRLGDHVVKGQLLAVIWSKDVGEKKSDLVNSLSKLILDQAQLDNLKKLGKDVVAEKQVRQAERDREEDIIEVDRLERTLRSWRLTEAEINVVRAEAEKIHRGDVVSDMDVDKSWAEVEVRSPLDGIVLEKNVVAGDYIADTSLDLFKIADLSVLGVMTNVYEEDLPTLESLGSDERRWTIHLKSQAGAAGIEGTFELIGNIVDPNQHTAAVMGWLDNQDGRLRAGQFITATVELPVAAGQMIVPDTAIVQDGSRCVVFVTDGPTPSVVQRRQVALVGRGQDAAYIRAEPNEAERARGCQTLAAGQWVVVSGCLELDGALEDLLASAPEPRAAAAVSTAR